MCVDYRDLNRESPKDDFSLPHIDVLVDNTAQHKVFSCMDGVILWENWLGCFLFDCNYCG